MTVEQVPLSRILQQRLERTPVRADAEYPIAGVLGFGRGLLLREPIRGTETQYNHLYRLAEGDVVYSKVKAFEGAFTVVNADGDGRYVSPEFPVFRVSPDADPRYVHHFLASETFTSQIRSLSSGIGARRERVSPSKFLSILIPLPSLPDQRRIAAHLNSVAATITQVEEARNERRSRGEAAARSLWNAVSASTQRLGSVLRNSRTAIDLFDDVPYRSVGLRSFGKGFIVYPATVPHELSKLRYFKLEPNRLVVSNIKGWEGAIGVTGEAESGPIASNRFLQYELSVPGSLDYVKHWLLSPAGLQALGAASPGSADRNRTLAAERFEQIQMPWPPLQEQGKLASLLTTIQGIVGDTRAGTLASALLPAARNEIFNALR